MKCLVQKFGLFRRKEDGTATIEFVVLFPLFFSLLLMGLESGFYMVRSVMLERAVDLSVREIRLGNGNIPQFEDLRRDICENAVVLPNCTDSVQVHMERIDIEPGGVDKMRGAFRCITKNSSANALDDTDYDVGEENSMMVLRVCMMQDPFFPTTGIGAGLGKTTDGRFAIVATSAFVNEPGTRAFASDVSGPGTGELDEQYGTVEEAGGDDIGYDSGDGSDA